MATQLLNDDGTASMATLLMCSHHAFRRDVADFAKAIGDPARDIAVLAEEWTRLRFGLHGHHAIEDNGIFPDLRAKQPQLAATMDKLDAHHRAIDPLLERGDKVFAARDRAAARDVIDSLARLLDEHLTLEEATITPSLRGVTQFPPPPSEEMLAMYAEGFAWSSAGIAESVLDKVFAMLPPALVAKIPAARAAFAERSRHVWGYVHTGASTTSVPA